MNPEECVRETAPLRVSKRSRDLKGGEFSATLRLPTRTFKKSRGEAIKERYARSHRVLKSSGLIRANHFCYRLDVALGAALFLCARQYRLGTRRRWSGGGLRGTRRPSGGDDAFRGLGERGPAALRAQRLLKCKLWLTRALRRSPRISPRSPSAACANPRRPQRSVKRKSLQWESSPRGRRRNRQTPRRPPPQSVREELVVLIAVMIHGEALHGAHEHRFRPAHLRAVLRLLDNQIELSR